MTARSTRLLRSGGHSLADDPDTGLPRYDGYTPDIYGHVDRTGWRVHWRITAIGERIRTLKTGWALTKRGAWAQATAAAQSPTVLRRGKARAW